MNIKENQRRASVGKTGLWKTIRGVMGKWVGVLILVIIYSYFLKYRIDAWEIERTKQYEAASSVSLLLYNGHRYVMESHRLVRDYNPRYSSVEYVKCWADYGLPEGYEDVGELKILPNEGGYANLSGNMQLILQEHDLQNTAYDQFYQIEDRSPDGARLYYNGETDSCYVILTDEKITHDDSVAVFVRDDGRYEFDLWEK